MKVQTVMKAVQFERYGSPDVLTVRNIPIPAPQQDELLIRVRATSVNPHDVAVRSGRLRAVSARRFPKGIGLDFAGEVADSGDLVTGFHVGDRVWGTLPGIAQTGSGAAAEFVTVNAGRIAHSPANLNHTQAVSLIAGGTTTITALRDKAGLTRGDRVLIRGATGGVGSYAVQFAHEAGAHVTALSSSKTTALAKELGADVSLDYAVTKPLDLPKYDVVFDTVGSDLRSYRRLLAPGGRMVSIAFGHWRSLAYVFATSALGSRRIQTFSGSPTTELLTDLTVQAENSTLKPVIDEIYALEDIAAAHWALQAGRGRGGKRVLQID